MRLVVDTELVARFIVGSPDAAVVAEMERRMLADPALAAEVAELRALAERTRLLSRREVRDGASGR